MYLFEAFTRSVLGNLIDAITATWRRFLIYTPVITLFGVPALTDYSGLDYTDIELLSTLLRRLSYSEWCSYVSFHLASKPELFVAVCGVV